MESRKKSLELDKICRVCLIQKKDMRPIFGEMISDMLMECTHVKIENTDGWPDKICVQCVHSVSRFHAFKMSVEKSDRELREYINGLIVVVEVPKPPIIKVKPIAKLGVKQHSNSSMSQPEKIKEKHTEGKQIVRSDGQVITNGQIVDYPLSHLFQTSKSALQFIQPVGTNVKKVETKKLLQLNIQTEDSIHEEIAKVETHFIDQQGFYHEDVEFLDEDNIEKLHEPNVHDSTDLNTFSIEINDESGRVVEHFENVVEINVEANTDLIQEDVYDEQTTKHQDPKNEMHADQEEKLVEEEEEYETEDDYLLVQFIKSQTCCLGPGRFECILCHQQFRQQKWLLNHMKSHSNWIKANRKMATQCEVCNKTFKGAGMLRMHMRSHESSKNVHMCNICKKQFKTRAVLYGHMRSHRGRTFACGYCSKKFYTHLTIDRHMDKEHLPLQPKYKCSDCHTFYSTMDLMNKHLESECQCNSSKSKKKKVPA